MADQETNISIGPLVQVIVGSDERVFPFSDLALEGDDPATISDKELVSRVARWMDLPESNFSQMVVTRPETGNILVSPRAVFG